MKNISELYNNYISIELEERRINEKIIDKEKQIERLKAKKDSLGGWVDRLVKPLAEVLMPLLDCVSYRLLGPFGLRGEISIWFLKPNSTAEHCDYSLSLTFIYQSNDDITYKGEYCHPTAKKVILAYDTGERKNEFPQGSIGEKNGFNTISKDLPESIDELVTIIKNFKENCG